MNTIVKYNNQFNQIALRNFSSQELDLLISIASKVKEKGIEIIEVSFLELKKYINLKKKHSNIEFMKSIINVNKKLLALNFTFVEGNVVEQFTLFKKFKVDGDNKILYVSVNEDFFFLLNQLTSNFTRFELKEFVTLKSSYTKEFYRRMKQFRKTGFWRCSIEEFRNLLDIPEKYRIIDIDKFVLKPIQKELGEKYELNITKKYGFSGGRGRSRVTGFEFKFSTEKKVDIVAVTEEEEEEDNNNNPIPLSKPRKQKKKEETRVVSERKTRIVEAPPKIEKEKTLREKIWDKINENTKTIENLEAIYTGLKDKIQFRKLTEKYPQKIEEIKNMNMQLKAIYNIDENDFTQEIIELAEDLIIK